MIKRGLTVEVEFKPQDIWIGVFWRRSRDGRVDVWVILPPFGFPALPIHVSWGGYELTSEERKLIPF